MSVKEKTKKESSSSAENSEIHEIILYNDDINTFDHVIDCLISICDHTPLQAEDGIRDVERSRGLGDVYKRQVLVLLHHQNKLRKFINILGIY